MKESVPPGLPQEETERLATQRYEAAGLVLGADEAVSNCQAKEPRGEGGR